jgi:hypothetical protein
MAPFYQIPLTPQRLIAKVPSVQRSVFLKYLLTGGRPTAHLYSPVQLGGKLHLFTPF